MKQVAGSIKLELAQYREMAAFAQFASDLDASTQRLLARGVRLTELLKQAQYSADADRGAGGGDLSPASAAISTRPVNKVTEFEERLLSEVRANGEDLLETIRTERRDLRRDGGQAQGVRRQIRGQFRVSFAATRADPVHWTGNG